MSATIFDSYQMNGQSEELGTRMLSILFTCPCKVSEQDTNYIHCKLLSGTTLQFVSQNLPRSTGNLLLQKSDNPSAVPNQTQHVHTTTTWTRNTLHLQSTLHQVMIPRHPVVVLISHHPILTIPWKHHPWNQSHFKRQEVSNLLTQMLSPQMTIK